MRSGTKGFGLMEFGLAGLLLVLCGVLLAGIGREGPGGEGTGITESAGGSMDPGSAERSTLEKARPDREKIKASLYHYARDITADRLMDKLSVLAHDSLEGRETGTDAEWKTVQFLRSHYERAGFDTCGDLGNYLQPVPMIALRTDSLVYEVRFPGGSTETQGRMDLDDRMGLKGRTEASNPVVWRSVESDVRSAHFLRTFGGTEPLDAEIYFSGFGLYEPSLGMDHLTPASNHTPATDETGSSNKRRFVLIFDELPEGVLPGRRGAERMRDGKILRNPDVVGVLKITHMDAVLFEEASGHSRRIFGKLENIRPADAPDNAPSLRFPGYYGEIHPYMAVKLLGLSSVQELVELRSQVIQNMPSFQAKPTGATLQYQPYEGPVSFTSHNVAACLKGADPVLREETVVIMAHLDHIGVGNADASGDQIYNGADDNGSGTSTLMTLAQTFQRAAAEGVRPARSLMFLHVSGEEKGLLGSRYYSENPIIPMDRTVAALNIDMIGRSDEAHLSEGVTDYVYLIGGEIISSALDQHVVNANEKTSGFLLDRGYNDVTDPNQFYRRSDHWNFGRFGVPFVFFFTGVHEDYHQPGDHAEKIDAGKLEGVARIIYGSAVEVANADERPVVDNQTFIEMTRKP